MQNVSIKVQAYQLLKKRSMSKSRAHGHFQEWRAIPGSLIIEQSLSIDQNENPTGSPIVRVGVPLTVRT